jgi:hypothetical protein
MDDGGSAELVCIHFEGTREVLDEAFRDFVTAVLTMGKKG